MPALFGAAGRDAGAYANLGQHFAEVFGTCATSDWPDGWCGVHAHPGRVALGTDPGGRLFAVHGEVSAYSCAAGQVAGRESLFRVTGAGLELEAGARGTVLAWEPRSRQLTLVAEPTSYFPLYFAVRDGTIVFSSHLKPLSRVMRAEIDPAGLVHHLSQNWCLNGRTQFRGIRWLLHGQRAVFSAAHGCLTIDETSRLWSDIEQVPASQEDLWTSLVTTCAAISGEESLTGLMMSGGWDSRVLLAAYAEAVGDDRVVSVCHGEPRNHELRIARRLADRAGVRHLEVSLGPNAFGTRRDLDWLFDRTETLLFPYWRMSALRAREEGATVLACGLLGEIFGGHYTVRGSDWTRIKHYVGQLVTGSTEKPRAVTPEALLMEQLQKGARVPRFWYLRPEYLADCRAEIDRELARDVAETVARYRKRGITNALSMLQAFVVEHRALTMLAALPLAAQAVLDVAIPFADRRVIDTALRIPLGDRFERALCRSILERHRPSFLRLPLAATMGIPASASMPLHQAGRLARRGLDILLDHASLKTRGLIRRTRPFGWMNFDEVMRSGDELRSLTETLRADVFNRPAIARRVEDVAHYRSHVRLGHVFLRMVQLDCLLA